MPFLRDEGPPIPQASIQKLRESLPVEYGWQVVNESGREVLAVRVPKAKPDYLHDLAEVAFYVGLETVRSTKDVLLIGHEKCARLEPQLLRDHIRAQGREDQTVVDHLRRQLDRQYGHTFVTSPSNHQHCAFAVRIPKETVAQFTPDDVTAIRQLVASLRPRVLECQYAYVVANSDHERLGRRTLLELIGDPATQPAPAPVAPEAAAPVVPAPVAPSPPLPVAPSPAPARAIVFPSATPGATTAPVPAAVPTAVPAPIPAAPTAAPVVEAHEEYEVVSKPKAPEPAPAPAPAVAPAQEAAAVEAHDTSALRRGLSETAVSEEYEIVSKPKPAAAPAAPAAPAHHAQRLGLDGAEVVHEEYEVVSRKPAAAAPAPKPAAAPAGAASSEEDHQVLRGDKEFEVFTSKAKPKPEPVGITPPGMGGFQAALHGAAGPAPARTKEYEIIGRTSVTSDPSIASKLRLPSATAPAAPAPIAAAAQPMPAQPQPMQAVPFAPAASLPHFPHAAPAAPSPQLPVAPSPSAPSSQTIAVLPPVIATPVAPADSGAPVVVRAVPAAPELVLAQRFKENGYEVVEGLRAQGTAFAFAAHKPNGRRVLVRRTDSFAAEDAATLAQLVAALGADLALVVADTVKPGTRLATWGTRIEVVTPGDVPDLAF